MIKRLIACLTICLIVTGLINPVFSHASALPQPNWSDPGISEIINISDLTGWMLNGGTYDVSTYTDAESFMNDYYYARTSTKLESGIDLYYNQFGIGQDLYNIGSKNFSNRLDTNRMMSSSFREHSGYGRRFSEQANDALLSTGNLYDMKIPLLNEVEFANFVGYNHNALNIYGSYFSPSTPLVPNPDPNYESYLNNINGSGFWWKDFWNTVVNWNGQQAVARIYPWNSMSWWVDPIFSIPLTKNEANPTTSIHCNKDILNLYITKTNDLYSFDQTFTFLNDNGGVRNQIENANLFGTVSNYATIYRNETYIKGITGGNYTINYQSSGSLSTVLSYIQSHFRNVNIFVDGELWSLVSDPIYPPSITPEFPDAVGGEELPNTTWPISRPRAPYYTSVPGLLQAIEDAIQDDGKLDIDDLKPYLTDENGDPVPDPIFDPEPVPIPIPDPVNPDVVPGLPVLPAMPPEIPSFNGVSVLAEIINFTNQSLPTALIVTFWGIVFGIVILGLIKILHK